ncbi:MAG TPA: hypothetical protein VGS17_08460 [Candidatus Limnocylindria bacterium]|nr:hypothetical protein [Candidatus Limnocylindria bacterium]
MDDGRWQKRALIAVLVAVVLFVLPNFLVLFGAPVDLVIALSNLSLLALLAALVLLALAAYRRVRWSLALAGIALAAEIGATLLLLVQEPQPAYLHPEWAWYWPVVNTLYFGGLLVCLVALVSTTLAVAAIRSRLAATAFLMAAAALVVNRIAPYR